MNEASALSWMANVWNDLGVSGYFPCLQDPNNPTQCLGGNRVTRAVADGEGAGTPDDPFLVGSWESLACVGRSGANDGQRSGL